MSHEFTLVLTAPAETDEQVNALYDAGLADGTVSTSGGITRIDVTREAESLETAIRSAIGEVNAAGLSAATVEIEAEQIVHQPAVQS
ncbi:MAG TPA: hypothetical protein VGI40_03290 [Pirellulaceae bacterium]|jgi:hypothetical protein